MNRLFRTIALAASLVLGSCSAAVPVYANHKVWSADIKEMTVIFDGGGYIDKYYEEVDQLNKDGIRVRIKGSCWSACTLYLTVKKVCVENTASFHFHAPRAQHNGQIVYSTDTTKEFLNKYPAHIKAWIERNGGLGRDWLHFFGPDIGSLAPLCE